MKTIQPHSIPVHISLVFFVFFPSPVSPDAMDWRTLFPAFFPAKTDIAENLETKCSKVEFADIGCGYGGLLGKEL